MEKLRMHDFAAASDEASLEHSPSGVDFLTQIREIATQVCAREGCELYDMDWVSGHHGKGRTLRLFVDKIGGVTLDDCTNVSRALNLLLDVDDVVPGASYSLEVSSPGLERLLRSHLHFERAVGNWAQILLKEKRDQLLSFRGKILQLEGENLGLELESGRMIQIQLSEVKKAKTIFKEEKTRSRGSHKRGAHGSR